MCKKHGIRRWLLGSLVILAVASAVLGGGPGASAAKKGGGHPRPGYGSKAAFELECKLLGGKFWEDEHGNTNCRGSGRWVQCDANGNDCWVTPTRHRPKGGANSPDGTGEQNEGDGGGSGVPGLPGEPAPKTVPKRPGANG